MTFYTDLLTLLETRIEATYTGDLTELGDQTPFDLSLAEMLKFRDYLRTSGGGGGPSSITTNTSIEYDAGASTAKTQRVVVADFTPKVKELTSALITRAANTTPYSISDSYGGRGVFNVGSIGQSLFINDFQVIIDITAIPANMALSVRFFTTEADTQVTGAPVSDNSLLTATLPNTATPADGYPLTISVIGDKVFAVAKNIKFITPLEATSLWFYLRCNTAFTPAANSETMRAKASCEVY
jgi:hypothetical protein